MKQKQLIGIVLVVLLVIVGLWQLLPTLNKSSNIRIGINRANLSNANRNLLT
jgi:hypothetical protein